MERMKIFIKNGGIGVKIIVGLFFIIIVVIIVLMVTVSFTGDDNGTKIDNIDETISAPDIYKDNLKALVNNLLKENDFMDSFSNNVATVRDGSYSKNEDDRVTNENFIIDFEDLHYSFDVTITWPKNKRVDRDFDITIECPHYLDVIYTDTKCIAETAVSQIKKYLPHYEKVDGIKYAVSGKGFEDFYLKVEIPICNNNELKDKTLISVKTWIKSLYLDPDDYRIEIVNTCG